MKGLITACLAALFFGTSASASTLIDFDSVDTSTGPVGGLIGSVGEAEVVAYFNSYGITVSDPETGTALYVQQTAGPWTPYSPPNVFSVSPGSPSILDEGSVRLNFSTPLTSFSFIRCQENAGSNTFDAWSITAYDGATALGSFGEGVNYSWETIPAQSYTLTGSLSSPITSIVIYESSNGWAGGPTEFDNFTLTQVVPEPISMIFFGTGLVAVGGFVARRRMAHKA